MSGYQVYIATQSAYHEKIFVDMEDSSVVEALKPIVHTPCLLDSVQLKQMSVALTDFQRKDRIVDWLKRHTDERIFLLYLHPDDPEMFIPVPPRPMPLSIGTGGEAEIRAAIKKQIDELSIEVLKTWNHLVIFPDTPWPGTPLEKP